MRGDARAPKRCRDCQDDAYIVTDDGVYLCARCFVRAPIAELLTLATARDARKNAPSGFASCSLGLDLRSFRDRSSPTRPSRFPRTNRTS